MNRANRINDNSPLVTDNEKDLIVDDKLDLIDFELHTLIKFCKDNGYRTDEINLAAKPFLQTIAEVNHARRKRVLLLLLKCLCVCVCLVGVVVYVGPVNRYSRYVYRKTLISILPYWDWSKIAQRQCLVYNLDFKRNRIVKDDCSICESYEEIERVSIMSQVVMSETYLRGDSYLRIIICESYEEIEHVSNISQVVMSETYLRGDLPVIVTDGMDDWPVVDITLDELNQVYQGDIIREYQSCVLSSNMRVRRGDHKLILHKVTSGEVNSFYAHWENCYKEASKVIRRLYHRPYFLPLMIELDDSNWMFISRDFHAKTYKEVDTRATMMMVAQVSGQFDIRLTPKSPCGQTCDTLFATLRRGDILVVPNFLWILDYLPLSDGENIAIGISGNFD